MQRWSDCHSDTKSNKTQHYPKSESLEKQREAKRQLWKFTRTLSCRFLLLFNFLKNSKHSFVLNLQTKTFLVANCMQRNSGSGMEYIDTHLLLNITHYQTWNLAHKIWVMRSLFEILGSKWGSKTERGGEECFPLFDGSNARDYDCSFNL